MREIVSLLVQVAGIVVVAGLAIRIKGIGKAMGWAIAVMVAANVVGQVMIADAGGGSFAGFILLPIYGMITVVAVRWIRARR